MKRPILLIITISIIHSCLIDRIETRRIKVTNNLGYDVYCFNSRNDSLKEYLSFLNYQNMEKAYIISNNSTNDVYNVPRNWNSYIETSDAGKMKFFFIPVDSIEKYGWNYVLQNDFSTRKLLLDIEELNKMNWHIIVE